jgi:hypothetical protein
VSAVNEALAFLPETHAAFIAEAARRDAAFAALCERMEGARMVIFTSDYGYTYVLHATVSGEREHWRITSLDEHMIPSGHAVYRDRTEALRDYAFSCDARRIDGPGDLS